MQHKNTSRNPYINLRRNVRRILLSDISDVEKLEEFMKIDLDFPECNGYLYAHPVDKFRGAKSRSDADFSKNPWVIFKRKFIEILNSSGSIVPEDKVYFISKEIGFLESVYRKEDWVSV